MWASSVQSRHMEKASFIPHACYTCRTSADVNTLYLYDYHARVLKNTCKQAMTSMSFAQRLKSMATPVKSDQQFRQPNRSSLKAN